MLRGSTLNCLSLAALLDAPQGLQQRHGRTPHASATRLKCRRVAHYTHWLQCQQA